MTTPDERPPALRSADTASTSWATTVEHQQQAPPRHADFYALAGDLPHRLSRGEQHPPRGLLLSAWGLGPLGDGRHARTAEAASLLGGQSARDPVGDADQGLGEALGSDRASGADGLGGRDLRLVPGSLDGGREEDLAGHATARRVRPPLPSGVHPCPLPLRAGVVEWSSVDRKLDSAPGRPDPAGVEMKSTIAIAAGEFPAVRIRGRLIVPARAIEEMVEAALADQDLIDAAEWVPEQRHGRGV